MNKKEIPLICIFVLIASLQLACSFSDVLGSGGEDHPLVEEGDKDQLQPPAQNDDGASPAEETDHPPADQSSCSKSFSGSMDLSDGQEFEAGDAIQVIFTLINTGTCTWDAGYNFITVGGDFSPASSELGLPGDVTPGESIQLQAAFTAPSQAGLYLSVWKMQDAEGGAFGQATPPNAPLRVKIRVIPTGNPQPTPTLNPTQEPSNPDASLEMDGVTMLEDECFDFNSGGVVDCGDSSADFRYSYSMIGGQLFKANYNEFAEGQHQEPDKSSCENANYAPIPQIITENKYKCFKIETVASTVYGWVRATHLNENGMTFDFLTFQADPPTVTTLPNTNLFVESQGQQITLLEGKCYDVWNGQINSSCSGIFAGFLFEEVTEKSLQVSQISPHDMYFSALMSPEPSKSDCMNTTFNTSPIWPISSTSYYCYQFVPSTTTYYGWLRPTSFNLGGLTFDYLTWESSL